MADLVVVLVLCFYGLNPRDQWQWEGIGYRTGFIAAAQLPLVVLLSGKRNIIGWLTGTSYERLNWLHRWVSRILFLTVTIHMGFWFVSWARYDYIKVKLTTDPITQRGFAAWCILLWIILSSLLPARKWNYEFFVVQHITTAAGFLAAVYLHLPEEVKVWIWLPIGLVIFDRLIRALATLFINISVFSRRTKRFGRLTPTATFRPLSGSVTRITIESPPISWTPGQHVFLTCHKLAPLQAHPFTIASIPDDRRMEFLVKSRSGGTERFLHHAEKSLSLPVSAGDLHQRHAQSVLVEGPYGRIRSLRQFDSVFLIAGSSGATYTVPLMRDIVSCWSKHAHNDQIARNCPAVPLQGAVTRYIRFIWVIRFRAQSDWFLSQLANVARDVRQLKAKGWLIEVDMSIYVTCDEALGRDRLVQGQQEIFEPSFDKPRIATSTQDRIQDTKKKNCDVYTSDSISSSFQSPANALGECGLGGTCCCRSTIENEKKVLESNSHRRCNCSPDTITLTEGGQLSTSFSKRGTDASSVSTRSVEENDIFGSSDIALLSGRPQPQQLLRDTLEQALGESAVVVCGPQGLVDEVRGNVVALSDERAVHKGTGAQGIYLHTESFGY
ncbi:MAG: hypothetical protein Q9210_000940 [Variospora velana]